MSSCACGHHHNAKTDASGETVPLETPLFGLHGRLICRDMGQMMTALELLPDVLFGAASSLAMDGLAAHHLLDAWGSGASGLRARPALAA